MEWASVAAIATVASAIFLIIGGVGGYFFASGGKKRDVEANTSAIKNIKDEGDARYFSLLAKHESIAEKHAAFEVFVASTYVKNEHLAATEQRLTKAMADMMEQLRSLSQNVMNWMNNSNR